MRILRGLSDLAANCVRLYRITLLSWEESRPGVQVMITGRFLAGAFLACSASDGKMRWEVVVGAFGWLAAGISVYLLNGLADITEDRANGSTRPIASGRLAARDALWLACSAAVLALAAAAVSGIIAQAALFLALGYLYSRSPWPAKRHWTAASVTITASGVVTFWAASLVVGCITDATVIAGTALALWMGLVGALVKDLPDERGDRISGRKTYAVAFGFDRVGRYAAALALVIGLSGSVASAVLTPFLLPSMVTLLVGGVMIAACTGRVDWRAGWHVARIPYRLFMRTQQVSVALAIASAASYSFLVYHHYG